VVIKNIIFGFSLPWKGERYSSFYKMNMDKMNMDTHSKKWRLKILSLDSRYCGKVSATILSIEILGFYATS